MIDERLKQQLDVLKSTRKQIRLELSLNPDDNIPLRYSKKILQLVQSEDCFNPRINDMIRKIHDFYGWKAIGTISERGLCAGAFYCTEEFLAIESELRSGKKENRYKVHIEHTIPVQVIYLLLISNKETFKTQNDVKDFILKYTVCTAFAQSEVKTTIKEGFSYMHPDILPGQFLDPNMIRPFFRYNHVKIYSVVHQKIISNDIILSKLLENYSLDQVIKKI